MNRFLAIVLALTFAPVAFAHADTVVLVSDRDNTLIENATGAASNGAGPTMFSGRTNEATNSRRRAVLHFDVAGAIPAGSTITGVSLRLNVSQASTATSQSIALHRVTADWGEGTSNAGTGGGAGAPSTANDATWLHRFFPGTLWGTVGGDFAPAATAALGVGVVGPATWPNSAAMIADAQGWLDVPGTNFGWLLRGNEGASATAKRFDTREQTDPTVRPALTIDFTPPGTPARAATWGGIKSLYR